jgi:VIT1/CCC1 family predicted Fe2+/Mn2+ transporter
MSCPSPASALSALALAGLVAAVVGSVMTRVGRKQPAPATVD